MEIKTQKSRLKDALKDLDKGRKNDAKLILEGLVEEKYSPAFYHLGLLTILQDQNNPKYQDEAFHLFQEGHEMGDIYASYEYFRFLISHDYLDEAKKVVEPLARIIDERSANEIYSWLIKRYQQLRRWEDLFEMAAVASDDNISFGSYYVGICYLLGYFVDVNLAMARNFFLKSIDDFGYDPLLVRSSYFLARIYYDEDYDGFNPEKGINWLKEALKTVLKAEQYDEAFAAFDILNMYEKKDHPLRNEVLKIFKKLTSMKNLIGKKAIYNLAQEKFNGDLTDNEKTKALKDIQNLSQMQKVNTEDDELALEIFQKANYFLGVYYSEPHPKIIDQPLDYALAVTYFKIAADSGMEAAAEKLTKFKKTANDKWILIQDA